MKNDSESRRARLPYNGPQAPSSIAGHLLMKFELVASLHKGFEEKLWFAFNFVSLDGIVIDAIVVIHFIDSLDTFERSKVRMSRCQFPQIQK